jgi:hypothetical protein
VSGGADAPPTDDDIIATSSSSSSSSPSPDVSDREDGHGRWWRSSSSSGAHAAVDHAEAAGGAGADERDLTSSSLLLTTPTPTTTSALASSKFRKPTAADGATLTPSTRPAFKTPPAATTTVEQSATASLPDAFSPSRRRAPRKDYLPGGAADTVRRWVLALAAATDEAPAGQTYTERFTVVETADDGPEARCSLVRDENGRRWLLVNERAQGGAPGSGTTARKAAVGCVVGVRTRGPAVNLALDGPMLLDESCCHDRQTIASEWSVGIMWDVLE